jgi:hypothetical protein
LGRDRLTDGVATTMSLAPVVRGSAAMLSSVVRPTFALLCESDAEKQY